MTLSHLFNFLDHFGKLVQLLTEEFKLLGDLFKRSGEHLELVGLLVVMDLMILLEVAHRRISAPCKLFRPF